MVKYDKNKKNKSVLLNPFLNFRGRTNKMRGGVKFNEMRNEQFHSYSNENMDFFRLNHLFESDRSSYHNKLMDKINPINRSQSFIDLIKNSKIIKEIDYLKRDIVISQNVYMNKAIFNNESKLEENYNDKKQNNIFRRKNGNNYDNLSLSKNHSNIFILPKVIKNKYNFPGIQNKNSNKFRSRNDFEERNKYNYNESTNNYDNCLNHLIGKTSLIKQNIGLKFNPNNNISFKKNFFSKCLELPNVMNNKIDMNYNY
jgi:hypothetical protein